MFEYQTTLLLYYFDSLKRTIRLYWHCFWFTEKIWFIRVVCLGIRIYWLGAVTFNSILFYSQLLVVQQIGWNPVISIGVHVNGNFVNGWKISPHRFFNRFMLVSQIHHVDQWKAAWFERAFFVSLSNSFSKRFKLFF